MSAPPLHHGWVSFDHGQVTGLGRDQRPAGTVDLGDVALLPGLINGHTHLEFSRLAAPLGQPKGTLSDWVGDVLQYRAESPEGDGTADRQRAIAAGLEESAAAGIRLLGEIATIPWTLSERRPPYPEVIAFCEVLGLQPARQQQTWAAAEGLMSHPLRGVHFGISPHAPYSTGLGLVKQAVERSHSAAIPLAMHVAESPDELELIESDSGPFRAILERLGVWQPGLFPWKGGMNGLLRLLSKAHRTLVVHGNYLDSEQIAFLASQPTMTVVYCPRTHDYFGHAPHPIANLQQAGVRVILGTDSRASNPDLNLWNEVRFLAKKRTDLNPEALIRMVTIEAADAFARTDCGRLTVGATPGLIAVPTDADQIHDLWPSLCSAAPTPVANPSSRDFIGR